MRVFRIAPSPTGRLHFGHTKPYLLNYALSRAYGGRFILRIEDTDQKRNQMETVKDIIADLSWLGIGYDEGPVGDVPNEYFQSQRLPIYQKYIQQLLDEGKAYKAYETPEEREAQIKEQRSKGKLPVYSGEHRQLTAEQRETFEKEGRKPVVRLKVSNNEIVEFQDCVYGKIKTNTNVIGDIVIQKSDGYPMYNFAVVIDDYLMHVTDVVRGYGHISNTPKQVLIYQTFGWPVPQFAHFSDILNENEPGKLSKRKGAKGISQYRAEGYLPDAIFNYIVVISSSFTFANKDEEIMSREEIYSKISYEKIIKTNSKFNAQKLDWFNGQHIRKLDEKVFGETVFTWLENDSIRLKEYGYDIDRDTIDFFLNNPEKVLRALPLIQARITRLADVVPSLKFLFLSPQKERVDISPSKHTASELEKAANILYNVIQTLSMPWSHVEWEEQIRLTADQLEWKHGDLFMALRLLIVGDRFSPPLFELMEILGKEECLRRIKAWIG